MNKTYSDIIDEKEQEIIEEENRQAKEEDRLRTLEEKRNDDSISKAIETANKKVGNRLSYNKNHYHSFSFYFKSLVTTYNCSIYFYDYKKEWQITEYKGRSTWQDKIIDINNLGQVLIEWIEINLKAEGVI
jgi:hypothetical protein